MELGRINEHIKVILADIVSHIPAVLLVEEKHLYKQIVTR
jgi:hypothetical protein